MVSFHVCAHGSDELADTCALEFGIGCSCSGSDISVLVREALMEPLRKCQQAQFFTRVRISVSAGWLCAAASLSHALHLLLLLMILLSFQCDDKATVNRNGQYLTPCEDDPPCAYCHMKLSSCPRNCPDCKAPCRRCGALRMRLFDLPERGFSDEKLRPPMIAMVRGVD